MFCLVINTQVILGGGRLKMLPNSESDPEYPFVKGSRKDGRNLVGGLPILKEHAAMDRTSWSIKSVCNRLI